MVTDLKITRHNDLEDALISSPFNLYSKWSNPVFKLWKECFLMAQRRTIKIYILWGLISGGHSILFPTPSQHLTLTNIRYRGMFGWRATAKGNWGIDVGVLDDIHSGTLWFQGDVFVSFAPVLPGKLCRPAWLRSHLPAKSLGGFYNPPMPSHQLNKLSLLFLEWWQHLFDLFGTID